MKEVDVRKIYLCEILKQKDVYKRMSEDKTDILFWQEIEYNWDYEPESRLGLFVKTLGGFKHILTGVVYPKASRKTENKYVVNPNNIELLAKKECETISNLIQKKQSYNLNMLEVNVLEERLNKEKEVETGSEM